jgi:TIR domain/PDZ domain
MIFINYRRDDSMGMAGRLYDRLAQAFGQENLFMDVDHIPAGVDFVNHLNNQVAACDVFIAVIGPNWLDARNEQGDRRLHVPGDFVTIEIAAALARDIRVIPVLIDGARMPKAGDLPEPLKPLVRRHAVNLRHDQFGRDAEALIEKVREALHGKPARTLQWRVTAAIVAVLLLLASIGLFVTRMPLPLSWTVLPREQPEKERLAAAQVDETQAKAAAEAEARTRSEQAEKDRQAAAQAERDRQAAAQAEKERQAAAQADEERKKAAAEADARAAAAQAEKERQAAANTQEERKAKAPAEGEAKPGWLGLRIQRVTDEIADAMNLQPSRGALVADVQGPMKLAGIEVGDVIVTFDGTEIKEPRDLARASVKTPPGKRVRVIIIRKGKEETRTVTVGALPGKQP